MTRRARPPLNPAALREAALGYVARYATTRAKLIRYLQRKVSERGWDGEGAPDIDGVADAAVANGFIDDGAFADARADALSRRGYGARRIRGALRDAGVAADVAETVLPTGEEEAIAAIGLARRRRLGPFGSQPVDPDTRRRQMGVLLRAGHGWDLAKRIVDAGSIEDLTDVATK